MLPRRKLRRPISVAKPTETNCSQTSVNSPCQCHVRGTVIKLVAGRGHISTYRSLTLTIAAWVLAWIVAYYRRLRVLIVAQPVESVVFADHRLGSRSLTLKVTLDGSRCSSRECLEHFLK